MSRRRPIAIGMAATIAALVLGGNVAAAPRGDSAAAAPIGASLADLYAQAGGERRARPRITIRPRRWSTPPIYPSPAPYNYPGPNAVRECSAWLAVEHRPSGTVLVPRRHCWWAWPR